MRRGLGLCLQHQPGNVRNRSAPSATAGKCYYEAFLMGKMMLKTRHHAKEDQLSNISAPPSLISPTRPLKKQHCPHVVILFNCMYF